VAGDGIHVGQRLKRLNTILDKLERQPKMDLGRMDDVPKTGTEEVKRVLA